MPKTRGSDTIANRNDTQTYSEQEMSNRIEDRLRQAGRISIEVLSQTRGIREPVEVEFMGSRAIAYSRSGNSYEVDYAHGNCTCPDNEHRHNRCRHIEAVDQAREQITQGTFTGSPEDYGVSENRTLREHIQNETQSEIQNHQRQCTDDGFFYSENPEAFQRDMERLRTAPIPYTYENVLNGYDTTFGIELEFVDGDSDAIARELYRLGICGSDHMTGYHSRGIQGKWKLESDGSVTNGRRGGELVSPVLQDTPETWRQIETICEVAKRHGARVSTKTGGHVHVGAEQPLDGKRQRWRRFFKMAAGFENVYFRLAGGEQGIFRGGTYASSSQVQSQRGITERMPEEAGMFEIGNIISRISRGKYQSINISHFYSSKKTIEFRAFNGSLTPGVIQANVKYAVGMINSSERSRIRQSEGIQVSEHDRKRGRIINNYAENNQRNDAGIMSAIDAVFSRKEDKEHIISVIAKNSWH